MSPFFHNSLISQYIFHVALSINYILYFCCGSYYSWSSTWKESGGFWVSGAYPYIYIMYIYISNLAHLIIPVRLMFPFHSIYYSTCSVDLIKSFSVPNPNYSQPRFIYVSYIPLALLYILLQAIFTWERYSVYNMYSLGIITGNNDPSKVTYFKPWFLNYTCRIFMQAWDSTSKDFLIACLWSLINDMSHYLYSCITKILLFSY